MARLPLVSSQELLKALSKLGFEALPKASGGSHLSMYRVRADGNKDTTTIVLGKREIPRGTLTYILKLAGVSRDEFISACGKR